MGPALIYLDRLTAADLKSLLTLSVEKYTRLHNWRCAMRRIKTNVVSVLLLLVMSMPAFAQDSALEQKSGGIWKKIADGVWVAKVPRFSDHEEEVKPEFAVLRLTAARYAEFQKDPKGFLNKYKIFDKDVRDLEACPAAKPKTEEPKVAYWYTMKAHWPGSSAACQAYPGWSEPKPSD
jgi:hypothetical protein